MANVFLQIRSTGCFHHGERSVAFKSTSLGRAHPAARIVTTEEVVIEVLNWFASAGSRTRSVASLAVRDVIDDPAVPVIPRSSADFHAAWALYDARPDKAYSLTDCRSMVAMKSLGLVEVLSNDHHFAQEGFTVLFP